MGFVVNKRRLIKTSPGPSSVLIPYSDSSKIVTYLVPDNFNGSSSTTWGNDYPTPMTKTLGNWDLTSDGKSVRLYNSINKTLRTRITAPSNSFTVYIVAQYKNDTSKIHGLNVRFSDFTGKILYHHPDGSGPEYIGSLLSSGNLSEFVTDTTLYKEFQTYALSYRRSAKPAHILNDMNVKYFPRDDSSNVSYFGFEFDDSTLTWEVDIKLLAIVSEADSDTVMQNNINYIRNQLNLT